MVWRSWALGGPSVGRPGGSPDGGSPDLVPFTSSHADYSKWDNIDTDSEPETSSPAAAPKATLPPAPASLLSSISTSMATDGASAPIQAVVVRCEAEKVKDPPWSTTRIPANHDVFSRTVPPVPGLIEVPLVLHQLGTRSANRADLDNQIATYLNINPDSGFAPPAWQSHVGTIIVARKDRKPLLPQHLEGVWIYCDHILDLFGEGGGAPRWLYNRQAFGKWWAGYCEEQKEFRLGKGGEEDPDDWQAVRSPYEI